MDGFLAGGRQPKWSNLTTLIIPNSGELKNENMKTIEDKIQEILAEHHECRWMDSSELENCLRRIATEQKAIDIEKIPQLYVRWLMIDGEKPSWVEYANKAMKE